MRLMKYLFHSDEVQETDALYMDGYAFGDRLLEGVPFKITIMDGELKAECLDKYQPGIDWEHWENTCVRYALNFEVFSTTQDLNDDDGFIDMEGKPND